MSHVRTHRPVIAIAHPADFPILLKSLCRFPLSDDYFGRETNSPTSSSPKVALVRLLKLTSDRRPDCLLGWNFLRLLLTPKRDSAFSGSPGYLQRRIGVCFARLTDKSHYRAMAAHRAG